MRIGIVLLPEKKTAIKLKQTSDILSKNFSCFFKLDSTHIPHATLLHGDVKDEGLEEIIDSVENIANLHKLISVVPQDLRSGFMFKTLIGVYFKDENEILALRQKVLNKVGKYLSNISSFMAPHVTITRLKRDEDVEGAISEVKNLILNDKFVFPSIGICKIGENGTCTKVIKSFELARNISGF